MSLFPCTEIIGKTCTNKIQCPIQSAVFFFLEIQVRALEMVLQSKPQCRSAGVLSNRAGGNRRSHLARCLSTLEGSGERSFLCCDRRAQSPWSFSGVHTSALGNSIVCQMFWPTVRQIKSGIVIWFLYMSVIVFSSQFWGHDHLFSACRGVISAALK